MTTVTNLFTLYTDWSRIDPHYFFARGAMWTLVIMLELFLIRFLATRWR